MKYVYVCVLLCLINDGKEDKFWKIKEHVRFFFGGGGVMTGFGDVEIIDWCQSDKNLKKFNKLKFCWYCN